MHSAEEIYRIIVRYGKMIRESLEEARYVYGEIYEDTVFGILLSAVSSAELRLNISDIAFAKYRESNAMCLSLERESIAADAMNTALNDSIQNAFKKHFGAYADEKLLKEFFEILN